MPGASETMASSIGVSCKAEDREGKEMGKRKMGKMKIAKKKVMMR